MHANYILVSGYHMAFSPFAAAQHGFGFGFASLTAAKYDKRTRSLLSHRLSTGILLLIPVELHRITGV